MTRLQCHWHNFRLMRPRVRGMEAGARQRLYTMVRGGPIMWGVMALSAVIAAELDKPN